MATLSTDLSLAQSLLLDYPVIGRDDMFDAYGVRRFWGEF